MTDKNSLISKVCEYVLNKNNLKRERNRYRFKAYYYERLFKFYGSNLSDKKHVVGLKKWNKPGKKQKLRLLYKQYRIKQLEVEINLHNLVMSSKKDLLKIKREMPFKLLLDTDYICAIMLHDRTEPILYQKDMEEILTNERLETIVLGKEKSNT